MIAPQQGGTGVASQTDTHGVRKLATALTGGVQAPKPIPPPKNCNYRHGDFAARPASGDTGRGLAGTTGGVFLLRQGGMWVGVPN